MIGRNAGLALRYNDGRYIVSGASAGREKGAWLDETLCPLLEMDLPVAEQIFEVHDLEVHNLEVHNLEVHNLEVHNLIEYSQAKAHQ